MVRIRRSKSQFSAIITLPAGSWRSIIAAGLMLVLTACSSTPGNKKYDARKINFSAEVNPLFDSQLYPSLILALNQTTNDNLSSQLNPFVVTVTAPADNALLRVVIDSSLFSYVTNYEEILPKKGETYTLYPSLNWKYNLLSSIRQSRPLDLPFTCYINDEQVITKNIHFTIRTINECPLSFQKGSQRIDTRWLFAAFVNEDHPYIEQILTEILRQGIVKRISGYQNGAKAVREQVFAVWYYALNRGISYSSISCTSNPSPNVNVQHIRFFDEVLNTRQANCIDACVFFASILRKIGIRPVILVEPCHAYLGYYTDSRRRNLALLETTITSWVNLPELEKELPADGILSDQQIKSIERFLTPEQIKDHQDGKLSFEQLKIAVARALFEKASSYNRDTYNANKTLFADSNAISYQLLDIEKLRQIVQPIN